MRLKKPKPEKNQNTTQMQQPSVKTGPRTFRELMDLPSRPVLRFSPTAWAKLLYFRDKTDNEVGGFGITESDDLLYVSEFVTVQQQVSAVSVCFDDQAVADFFDNQVDLGRKPEQFARIWVHCHPADSPVPSSTDEETFERVFGGCNWAVMFVVDRVNQTYARLSFNVGPGGQFLIPVRVDYSRDFGPSERDQWDAEYDANMRVDNRFNSLGKTAREETRSDSENYALAYDFIDELENMDPAERQFVIDELGVGPDPWDDEREVMF